MKTNRKISVIVPVYNVERYIERCIKSILEQTDTKIELILVDDGTKDHAGEICDRYAKRDKRTKVIHKENRGLSSARNAGLSLATGDYVMFVDGDDWLDRDCIKRCFETEQETDQEPDVIIFPYIREYKDKSLKNDILGERSKSFDQEELKEQIVRRLFGLYGKEMKRPDSIDDLSTAWGKIYRTDLVKEVRFVDTKEIGTEDAWFNINALSKARSAEYHAGVYYHYNKENGESLVSTYNDNLFPGWMRLYTMMEQYLNTNKFDSTYHEALNNRKIINLLALCRNIMNSSLSREEKRGELKKLLNNKVYIDGFKQFHYEYMDRKWKVFYKCCEHRSIVGVIVMTQLAECLKKRLR